MARVRLKVPFTEKFIDMSWLISPTSIILVTVATLLLLGLTSRWNRILTRLLAALILVLSVGVTVLACLGDTPRATDPLEEPVFRNGEGPGPLDPGCADPKTCGEPRPQSLDAGPSPQDCSDPKTCGEPKSRIMDGEPSSLDTGCADPETCGQPRRQPLDTGPRPQDCSDPKTCGEPRPHTVDAGTQSPHS